MVTVYSVIIPQLNPNEPEARLASLEISEGQQVSKGDLLCVLETTKSTAELESEADGFVVGLIYSLGQSVHAGEILCHIAPSPVWQPPVILPDRQELSTPLPDGLRISQPALELANKHAVELSLFPEGNLITTKMVQELIDQRQSGFQQTETEFDPTATIIYGGGGHSKSLIDVIRAMRTYTIAGIVDDAVTPGQIIMGIPVLGGKEVLSDIRKKGIFLAVNAVGGIGNLSTRIKVFQTLTENGFAFPVVVHPQAFIESSAKLSPGVQVFPHAYVGSEANVGFGAIINTGAIISHDCVLREYVNISPGAILAGEVQVGARVLIGMGATVNLQVKVGDGARIGNNATVKSDVPENSIIRAGSIWPD